MGPVTPLLTAKAVRFMLPPSLGTAVAAERGKLLEGYLTQSLGRATQVTVAANYEGLARELLAGRIDAAWAPPFVCARIEAMGVRVLARGVRRGASTYRGALVARAGSALKLETLQGKKAVWADRDSVGGYLLPMALLRGKGLDPAKTFFQQSFAGSYIKALEELLAVRADVTSVFAPAAKTGADELANIEELMPGKRANFELVALTEESPNDGVAVSMNCSPEVVAELEKTLLKLHTVSEGEALLKDLFHADRFEAAPRMGYRALYRVALASL